MSEVLFYHLERARLESVLPDLLERTLARGLRALVKVGGAERLEALDAHLWTYQDDGFLPHGTASDKQADRQPILLTLDGKNANQAAYLFAVDGADLGDIAAFERCVLIFDGADDAAVAEARGQWKRVKDAGCAATYWRQSESGKWEKQA